MIRNFLSDIKLGDIVQILDTENAPRSVAELGRKLITFGGMVEGGMKTVLRIFFIDVDPVKDEDLINSNLA